MIFSIWEYATQIDGEAPFQIVAIRAEEAIRSWSRQSSLCDGLSDGRARIWVSHGSEEMRGVLVEWSSYGHDCEIVHWEER